ncbi:MFS transporter [Sphaerisporangium aureirubrum]|uniref:MFS transporter n=1 Tax=Sphaerisporangium aureirubrum TaxID=1544736 RepID=A0ABW1NPV4_9ACTN
MSELPPLRRNFRFQTLWIGAATSELGTTLTWLAFPLLILAVTGSPAVAGLISAFRITTNLLVSLPAGVWVDRWDRRRILIVSEAVRFGSLTALTLAIFTDQVAIWHIVVVAVANGTADAFFNPARAAAIRAVVAPEQRASAYAQEEARSHAASLAGPPLGGVLFALGRVVPFAVDALTYLISMVCVILAKVPRHPETATDQRQKTRMRADIAEAGGWLWRQRGLRAGLAFSLVSNLVANALLLPVIVMIEAGGGDSAVTGLVLAGMGLGGLLGAMVSARIGALLPPGRLMLAVVGFFALMVCATALPFGAYWPAVPLFLAMVAVPALNVALQVLVAALVPDAMMGRLTSFFGTASMGLTPLAPLVGGVLAQYVGGAGALVIIGGLLALNVVLAAMGPGLRSLDIIASTHAGGPEPGDPEPARNGSAGDPVQLDREPVGER